MEEIDPEESQKYLAFKGHASREEITGPKTIHIQELRHNRVSSSTVYAKVVPTGMKEGHCTKKTENKICELNILPTFRILPYVGIQTFRQ